MRQGDQDLLSECVSDMILSFLRRVLELYQVDDIGEAVAVSGDAQTDLTATSLRKKQFFDTVDLRQAHYLHDFLRYQTPVDQVISLFEEVVTEYDTYEEKRDESALPTKFGEISDSLSTLDYAQIEQVYTTISGKGAKYRYMRGHFSNSILINILSSFTSFSPFF